MYSLEDYLKANSIRLAWITDAVKQILPVAGLDMASTVMQSYTENVYPLLLVEDKVGGYFSHEAEFLNVSVHNLWIMGKPKNPDLAVERNTVMSQCFGYGTDVMKLMVEDYNLSCSLPGWTGELTRWDTKRTSYMPMSNVGLCYGWLFMFNFNTDFSLYG
jgi:hypothetical protein